MSKDSKKRAIVMGATSGIGRDIAIQLSEQGWQVGVAGRRLNELEKLKIENENITHYAVIDITQPDAPLRLKELIASMGGMNLYLHSSGIGFKNVALDTEKELSTIETNCMGATRMLTAAFHYYANRPNEAAHIAIITSIAGTKGLGASPAYSSSKRFGSHYMECLEQLASIQKLKHISFTDIRPGFVRTPLIEGGNYPLQLSSPRVASEIIKAINRKKRVAIINNTYRLLVNLWRLIPSWLWVRLKIK